MSENIHEDLMPLYIVGGLAAIGGVFYLLNKNVDKLTATLAGNTTVQAITDPLRVAEKAAYSIGWTFWDWYDAKYTEPQIAKQQLAQANKEAEKEYAALHPPTDIAKYQGDFSLSDLMGLGNSRVDTLGY